MILRKLRLQRGWSQEQVAELTDLSVRTIQRIERGGQASLESANALAAVFEVDISTFQSNTGKTTMQNKEQQDTTPNTDSNQVSENSTTVTKEEKEAINYVKGIKEFYLHAFMFIIFMLAFLLNGQFSSNEQLPWLSLGWFAGVIIHALVAYEIFGSFGTNWEKKQIEKKLGRKL